MRPVRINTELAWQLTLLSRQQVSRANEPLTLQLPECAGHAIEVHGDGAWTSTMPVDPEAATLLDIMLPLCTHGGERLVLAQMGQSLDGRIATASGVSHYINGPDGLTHLHRLRALVDAVIVGAGTATADNPQLTVRHAPGPNPVRVVLDPNRRVPQDHQLFQNAASPTLRLVNDSKDLSGPGVTDVAVMEESGLSPRTILELLAARGLKRVLVEGGGLTVSRFLQAGLIDRLHVLVAPMIIGSGRPAFTLPPMATLEHALRPRTRVFGLGQDTLFELQPRFPGKG